ncbi:FAD-dependent monooxygenase [Amycolatopsis sp. H20-H5]|uniref:FAD-dependent monooxygenase n=1 Tax=Amycolatopsis sp. H20-H5 TaxID=3046309 RepID=UPI002DBE994A|nr:FAD-dependent monooxygenase [Amycolatopsis sp. H20-H5]MEC3977527.1 FAD-dependent monooxygenase [Amycolatopsis sp. H20-H5]
MPATIEPGCPALVDSDVLVVGAGPAGLMLALELQHRGVSCLVVDKADHIDTRTRAVMVHAHSLELLDELGVARRILAEGVAQKRIAFHLADGRSFGIDFTALDSRFPCYVNIDQPTFERVLTERFTGRGGRIVRDTRYVSHTETEDGGVLSSVRQGDLVREVRSRFIAGCDGASSAVRIELFGDEFPGVTLPFSYLLGEGRPRHELPGDESAMYVSDTGVVSVLPLPRGRFRVAGPFGGTRRLTSVDRLSEKDYTAALDQLGFTARLRLDPLDELAFYAVHQRVAPRLRYGRAFLLGDAAHLNAPAGGQAMNLGLDDAHDLAGRLAQVLGGTLDEAKVEQLLEDYHTERHARAHEVIASTDVNDLLTAMRTAADEADLAAITQKLTTLAAVWSQLPALRAQETIS